MVISILVQVILESRKWLCLPTQQLRPQSLLLGLAVVPILRYRLWRNKSPNREEFAKKFDDGLAGLGDYLADVDFTDSYLCAASLLDLVEVYEPSRDEYESVELT